MEYEARDAKVPMGGQRLAGASSRYADSPTTAAVNRVSSVGGQLDDNGGTLAHLLSELRDLESVLNVVMSPRPPLPAGNSADKVDPPFHVLDRLQVHGEGLRLALAHVQELRARLVL